MRNLTRKTRKPVDDTNTGFRVLALCIVYISKTKSDKAIQEAGATELEMRRLAKKRLRRGPTGMGTRRPGKIRKVPGLPVLVELVPSVASEGALPAPSRRVPELPHKQWFVQFVKVLLLEEW